MGKKWRTSKNGIKKNKRTKTKRHIMGGFPRLFNVKDAKIVQYSLDTQIKVSIKLNDIPFEVTFNKNSKIKIPDGRELTYTKNNDNYEIKNSEQNRPYSKNKITFIKTRELSDTIETYFKEKEASKKTQKDAEIKKRQDDAKEKLDAENMANSEKMKADYEKYINSYQLIAVNITEAFKGNVNHLKSFTSKFKRDNSIVYFTDVELYKMSIYVTKILENILNKTVKPKDVILDIKKNADAENIEEGSPPKLSNPEILQLKENLEMIKTIYEGTIYVKIGDTKLKELDRLIALIPDVDEPDVNEPDVDESKEALQDIDLSDTNTNTNVISDDKQPVGGAETWVEKYNKYLGSDFDNIDKKMEQTEPGKFDYFVKCLAYAKYSELEYENEELIQFITTGQYPSGTSNNFPMLYFVTKLNEDLSSFLGCLFMYQTPSTTNTNVVDINVSKFYIPKSENKDEFKNQTSALINSGKDMYETIYLYELDVVIEGMTCEKDEQNNRMVCKKTVPVVPPTDIATPSEIAANPASAATQEPISIGVDEINNNNNNALFSLSNDNKTLEETGNNSDNTLPAISNPLSNMFGSLMNTNIFSKIDDAKKMVIKKSAKIMLNSFLTMLEGLEQRQ